MKWLKYLILTLIIGGTISFYKLPNVCDEPIPYKIGTIDPRFNLSQAEVQSRIQEAEQSWEVSTNKDLFVYNPEADSATIIRMIYDDRQSYSAKMNDERNGIDKEKNSLQPRIDEFNRRSNELQKKVEAFNQKVLNWNKSSSQTEEDYGKLVSEQSALESETQALNNEAGSLQQNTRDYNLKVDELNDTISTLQTVVEAKPEEGLYEGATNTISIFYHNGRNELVHTIAHELGHALGLDHVANLDAIMFAKTNKTLTPTNDDLIALDKICRKETILDRVKSKKWRQSLIERYRGIMST